jgi:tRNA-binding EMAP/Myf-like protein
VQVVERHPDADSLYVCQVALGEETRQLVRAPSTSPHRQAHTPALLQVTGLVKYYSVEELQDRLIVVITNLKASKVTSKHLHSICLLYLIYLCFVFP